MSLKSFVEKVFAEVGIKIKSLATHIDFAKTVANNINSVLKNPIVDTLLSTITKGVSDTVLPKVETALDKIISDLSIASAVEADIIAAPNLESKLKVFITDMQKYGVIKQDMFLQKIESLLLAALDDQNLSQNLYDLYSQAQYSLEHKGVAI